ncbi:uncharacterized protein LOC122480225 [Prionailurus bengalensis]|uniref:uncharacterized protein LOC122480225 n=1 Tax=Prionailurus bengalensis TaxID=37029 RepID=UPI001CA8A66B|nr:uncharacterized protein LOC122480225 [Prionailurus bengalensis]
MSQVGHVSKRTIILSTSHGTPCPQGRPICYDSFSVVADFCSSNITGEGPRAEGLSRGKRGAMPSHQACRSSLLLFTGTAALCHRSGALCYLLCLIACLPGQDSMAGSCLQCSKDFHYHGGRTAQQPCLTRICSRLPRLRESKDYQCYLPRQEPKAKHTAHVFCPLGYFFIDRVLSCQPRPTGHWPKDSSGRGMEGEPLHLRAEGHFCPDGAITMPCLARTFESRRETPHPNTSFCSAVLSQCLQCPAGYFCPNQATQPIPCQPGTFSPNPGQDETTDCVPCPAGKACTQAGLTQPDAECTPGYVCPVGSSSPNAPTHACPPGTFSSRNNLSDLSQCEVCPSGVACPRGE